MITLDPPRWKNGPQICPVENLPAFFTSDLLDSFLKKNSPGCKVRETFCCTRCNHWHARTVAPDPCGGSSGTGRSSKEKL